MHLNLKYASVQQGRKLIGEWDEYLRSMNPFERSLKMKTSLNIKKNEFTSFLISTVQAWNQNEIHLLKRVTDRINEHLSSWNIEFPPFVYFVKTNGREEWNSAYTRGQTIFIPKNKFHSYDENGLLKLIVHELFHILTRQNPNLRDNLYKLIGYKPISKLFFPDTIRNRRLTNPDAPFNQHYIEGTYNGTLFKLVPLALLKEGFNNVDQNQDIFASLSIKYIVIKENNGTWDFHNQGSGPLLLNLGELSGIWEQIGENTPEITHPEEIMAENFVIMITGKKKPPTPLIIQKMMQVLS